MTLLAACKFPSFALAVCALSVVPGETLIRLLPAGQFDAPRGALAGKGPWLLNEAGARQVAARVANRSIDLVVDYEHQTLLAERNGKPAPAAGWIDRSSLVWRDDGLYGAVAWNAAAAQSIDDGEYRYLSPVFTYNPETGEVLDLRHVALTNTPAIDTESDIPSLAAARMAVESHPEEEDLVNLQALIKLLGLAQSATEKDVETALAALKAQGEELAALRTELDVADDGDPKEAVAALKTQAESRAEGATPDLSAYVPRAVFDEAQAQLAVLKVNGEGAEVERLVESGLQDGRIAGKATADWLRGQGLAVLKAHLEDAPAVAALRQTQTNGKPRKSDEDAELSAEELAVCKAMGIKPDDFKKTKQAS